MEEQKEQPIQQNTKKEKGIQFDTPEDIIKEFKSIQIACMNFEDAGQQDDGTYENVIQRFQKVQQSIISHSLFSPNEPLKEVVTEYLNFLLIPYYIGETFGRILSSRRKNLEYSQIYLNEYIKLCDHYELVESSVKKNWKSICADRKYVPSREDKISSYKEQKALETKLKNIDMIKDEDTQREVVLTQIKICILKTNELLKTMNQEFDILDYKDKITKDDDAKKQHEKEMNKPIPEIKAIHIPKTIFQKATISNKVPYLMSDQEKQDLCHSCHGKSLAEIREIKKELVFQQGGSQASVALDTLADGYIEMMDQQEKIQKQMAEKQKLKEEEEDSDKDEYNEIKVKEERAWENWKDENEKGIGNRKGNY